MTQHAARLAHSPRLQRVLKVLEDGDEHSTLEIQNRAQVCSVSSCISELRKNDAEITCVQRAEDDGLRWYYRMTRRPENA